MSYTKQTWAAGDKITSAKLNHMEDGIGNAIKFIAVQYPDDPATDPYIEYSFADIVDLIDNGTLIVLTIVNSQNNKYLSFITGYQVAGSNFLVPIDTYTWLQADTSTENMTVHLSYNPNSGSSSDEEPPR